VFWVGVFGLAVISLWHWPVFRVYHYREARRATGLWNNPNTYGLLAACLSAACLAWLFRLAPWKQTAGNQRLNQTNVGRRAWLLLLPLVPALLGMVRSYSRGAWLGFLLAMVWCGWVRFSPGLRSLCAHARAGSIPHLQRWLAIRWTFFLLLVGGFSSLWFLKDFQNPLFRRVGTVVNHTDRSWRNRVDAWVGAARMTVARPITGWGLHQVDATYAREFKPAHLKETAAIQLNDFLTLAAGMGVPAVGLFLVLVVSRLCLAHRERNPKVAPLLVLLVGCWFDGVLFRIPLAVPFWVLLLAATGNTPEILARPRPSSLSSANFTGLISG
jgi:O-antigen ligase